MLNKWKDKFGKEPETSADSIKKVFENVEEKEYTKDKSITEQILKNVYTPEELECYRKLASCVSGKPL